MSRRFKVGLAILLNTTLLLFYQNFSSVDYSPKYIGDQIIRSNKPTTCENINPPDPGTFKEITDVVYTERISMLSNEVQAFDYTRPADNLIRPLAILVHGGGWQNGSKDEGGVKIVASRLVKLGFAVANFNYPLVTETRNGFVNQFPIPVQALRCGLRYLNKNAAAMRFDKNRVVTYGASAGGNLSTMLAYAENATSSTLDSPDCEHKNQPMLSIRASISNSGVYAFRLDSAFDRPGARAYLGNSSCNPLVAIETNDCREFRWNQSKLASPRQYIKLNTPPSFTIHSKDDGTVNYEQQLWLTRTLRDYGVEYQAITIDGKNHVPNIFEYENLEARSAMCELQKFLEKNMGPLSGI